MIKRIIKLLSIILLFFVIIFDFIFIFELKNTKGNVTKATMGMLEKVANTVTNNEPIYVVILGVNNDLEQSLADTIMCLGFNPKTRKSIYYLNT